uniref:integrin alpha-6-like isoform X2 n=1 Tax=Myxine glutinosa TaxID=7769 RepID=UPI00358F71C4
MSGSSHKLFLPEMLRFALLLAALVSPGSLFNLDTTSAIVKRGPRNSLFGYAIAFHQQSRTSKPILLVGAPKAISQDRKTPGLPTGAIYSCPTDQNCKEIKLDMTYNSQRENVSDQWLGVVVRSAGVGGKVLACAHRYQLVRSLNNAAETRSIVGRCFLLNSKLGRDNYDAMAGRGYMFCDKRESTHERFGVCQQGLDAGFTEDSHFIFFGATGAYSWKGVVHVKSIEKRVIEFGEDDGPYETGDAKKKIDSKINVQQNSYLGFSIESSKNVISKKYDSFVAGAPRDNHTGSVIFLRMSRLEYDYGMEQDFKIEGYSLAASFGYDIALADLNHDGWMDLIVGAPQVFDLEKKTGGAVYVYMNRNGNFKNEYSLLFTGAPNSMFGLAVANIGDINQDTFTDFAVGAPYDGKGKVYIYRGQKNSDEIKNVQVIDGEEIMGMDHFGVSLAGGWDIDGNTYPDIAVGSLNDRVAIISLKLKVCFEADGKVSAFSSDVILAYSVESVTDEAGNDLKSYISLQYPEGNSLSSGKVILRGTQTTCIEPKVLIQNDMKDKLRPVNMKFRYDIEEKQVRRRALDAINKPVLETSNNFFTIKIPFLKEGCGRDNTCNSNLKLKYEYFEGMDKDFVPMKSEKGKFILHTKNTTSLALKITVENNGEPAYDTKLITNHSNGITFMPGEKVETKEVQFNCVPHTQTQVICEVGNPVRTKGKVVFYMVFSTSEMKADTEFIDINLSLGTTSTQANIPLKMFSKVRVITELNLIMNAVAKPSRVYFGEHVDSLLSKNSNGLGSVIEHNIIVYNFGKPLGNQASAYINITLPDELQNGKRLLYVTPENSKSGVPCKQMKSSRTAENSRLASGQDPKKIKKLDCDNKNIRCQTLQCPLTALNSSSEANVRIFSKLWNSTFQEEFADMNSIVMIAWVNLGLQQHSNNIIWKNTKTNMPIYLRVFPETSAPVNKGFPWWIILVAILLGLLLTLLMFFILWKVGCLTPNGRQKNYEARYNKNKVEVQTSEREKLASNF